MKKTIEKRLRRIIFEGSMPLEQGHVFLEMGKENLTHAK